MTRDSAGYFFPPSPGPEASEWPGDSIGASNVITRTKGRTKVHDKGVDREPGKLEKLLASVRRYREANPGEPVWTHDIVIHGIRVRAETNSRHLHDFWVENWYSPEEWLAQTGQPAPDEPQVRVYAYGGVEDEPEAAYYSRREATIVFFNTSYYGQLKSWVLGAVGRVLAAEYGIHSVHGACVEKDGRGLLYIAPTGTGKSLDGRARVLVETSGRRQFLPIGEFVDEIMSRQGWPVRQRGDGTEECLLAGEPFRVPALDDRFKIEWRPLRAILRHAAPTRMIRVTTRSGRSVLATEDHSFLKLKDGRLEPVAGPELRVGDYLPVARRTPETFRSLHALGVDELAPAPEALVFGSEVSHWLGAFTAGEATLEEAGTGTRLGRSFENFVYARASQIPAGRVRSVGGRTTLPEAVDLDAPFGYLVGLYLAEGNVDGLGVHITNADPDVRERLVRSIQALGLNATQYRLRISASNGLLGRIFEEHCRTGSGRKRVPSFAWAAPLEFVRALLQGYFDGDSWVSVRERTVRATTKSEPLAKDIAFLLSFLGIYGEVKALRKREGRYFEVRVGAAELASFARQVGLRPSERAVRLREALTAVATTQRYQALDVIPNFGPLNSLIHLSGVARRKQGDLKLSKALDHLSRKQLAGRAHFQEQLRKLRQFAPQVDLGDLEDLAHSDVYWDQVVSTEEEQPSGDYVYDLSVEGFENFLTEGGLIVHNSTSSYGLMEFEGSRFHSDDWVYIRYAYPTHEGERVAPTRVRFPGGEVRGYQVFRWLEEHGGQHPEAEVEGLTLGQERRRLTVADLDLYRPPAAYAYISEKVFYIRTNLVENFPQSAAEFLRSEMENVPEVTPEFLKEHRPLLDGLLAQVRDSQDAAGSFKDRSDQEVRHLLARLFAFDNGRAMLNIGRVFPEEKVYLNPMEPVRLANVFLLQRDHSTDVVLRQLAEGEFLGSLLVGRTPEGKHETAYNAYRAVLDEDERAFVRGLMEASDGDEEALYGLYRRSEDVPESLREEFELFRVLTRSTRNFVLNTILMKDPEVTERGQAVAYTMGLIVRTVEEPPEETVDLQNYRAFAGATARI